jgi:lipid-binding SYLF domain-containing protein
VKTRHWLSFILVLASTAITGCEFGKDAPGAGISTTAVGADPVSASNSKAAQLDANVDEALAALKKRALGSDRLIEQAKGVLVFPNVYKGGIGIGAEYGKGALRANGHTVGYYSTASGSFGFQLGAEARTIVFMFMTDKALSDFENSAGWSVGGNADVALVKVGANGQVDSSTVGQPVIAFVYGNTGLMYDLSLQGTKITKITM